VMLTVGAIVLVTLMSHTIDDITFSRPLVGRTPFTDSSCHHWCQFQMPEPSHYMCRCLALELILCYCLPLGLLYFRQTPRACALDMAPLTIPCQGQRKLGKCHDPVRVWLIARGD